MKEHTLAIVKPDAVSRGILGEVISRFERAGLAVERLDLRRTTREEAEKHYDAHRGRPYFEDLVTFTASAPVALVLLSGEDAVVRARALAGGARVEQAGPGTIRADLGLKGRPVHENVVHTSDAPEAAAREIALWFGGRDWTPASEPPAHESPVVVRTMHDSGPYVETATFSFGAWSDEYGNAISPTHWVAMDALLRTVGDA